MEPIDIRDAQTGDAGAMLDIYRPLVVHSAVSFELEPPSLEEFATRLARGKVAHPWLVATRDSAIVGYAYATSHRARAAYQYSAETSIYIAAGARRGGVGCALYTQLLETLRAGGYCNAYAGITLPNPASVGFHQELGFARIGVFPSVGYKFGKWHDVSWWHRKLRELPIDDQGAA